jgi:hypothetical protein
MLYTGINAELRSFSIVFRFVNMDLFEVELLNPLDLKYDGICHENRSPK